MDKRTQRPKIWMYKDKATGRMKGECTVTFDDPFTAKSAIQWFDGKEFMGRVVKVRMSCLFAYLLEKYVYQWNKYE